MGAGLIWTEYWYLLASVAAAIVIVDPLGWELAAMPVMKHLALALAVPALVLTAVGNGLDPSRSRAERPPEGAASVLWPLLVLGSFILAGGVHARFAQDIQNTFINVGLYMGAAYCAAAMVLRSGDPEALVRGHVRILLAAAAVMSAYLIANFGVRQVYHEQIFVVIPMAVLFFAHRGSALARWMGCLYFLAMAWLSAKYTSYLIAALTVAYLAFFVTLPRLAPAPGLRRTMLIYWTWVLGGLVTIAFAYLGVRGLIELPTGNVDYRMHTYTAAWQRFLDSPLWGTLFAVEAVEKFTRYSIGVSRNLLATHSDALDLLANGGIVAVGLWLWAMARVARLACAGALRFEHLDRSWAPHAHTLAVMSLAAVVTYAFNPILLQPSMAYLVWTNLGLLLGLALRVRAEERAPEASRAAPGGEFRRPAGAAGRYARGIDA